MLFAKIFSHAKKKTHGFPARDLGDSTHNVTAHTLSANLEENIRELRLLFERCSDVVMRELKISTREPIKVFLLYLSGLSEKTIVNEHLVQALQLNPALIPQGQQLTKATAFTILKDHILGTAEVKIANDMQQLLDYVLSGDVALLIDGSSQALIPSAKGWETRGVTEPETEPVVRGPRDGFTENLHTNISLIRRRIKTYRMKIECMKIGELTKTDVAIAYIDGIVNDALVDEVRQRLERIKIDGIIESGYLEELIEDQPFSPFPQVNVTERPDKIAANLLEGYIAIIVDTTPIALIVPATFPQFLQSTEDYYNRFHYATFIRLLRFIAVNVTLLLPSFYIAIITFHQEALPTPLLISIANQREGVPFPAFLEALFMEALFEILREAGIRLPRPVGQAVSIVGALVIGDAAVKSGLVSPAVVMVVALTAISAFAIPNISGSYALRLLRFGIMILAATFGLFGIMAALMAILIHLSGLRSFGVPYLSPLTPSNLTEFKDMMVRVPWWAMLTRPREIAKNQKRQPPNQMPGPHQQAKRAKTGTSKKRDEGNA